MPRAYVLIRTALGREFEVARAILRIQGVKTVDVVYGIYDLIAIIEADSMTDLRQIVAEKIRRQPGVSSTVTMIVLE